MNDANVHSLPNEDSNSVLDKLSWPFSLINVPEVTIEMVHGWTIDKIHIGDYDFAYQK